MIGNEMLNTATIGDGMVKIGDGFMGKRRRFGLIGDGFEGKQRRFGKIKELLVNPSNQLQLFDTSDSIAWAPDDVFAQVMAKEGKCCIRGVGFGPSPRGQSSKSALTDIQIRSSQVRDDEVAELKASLANMQEKLSSSEEMKERLSQFEEMEQRMARMLQ
ncbi:hypothetical protein SO802_031938 [Lithocarpus litseifolius]|uniref:Uncharacterized protein n=1 Tax=Lithocarpus litseifolius TaxID=425828 RepID=A0AAW2BPB1_9ROSI